MYPFTGNVSVPSGTVITFSLSEGGYIPSGWELVGYPSLYLQEQHDSEIDDERWLNPYQPELARMVMIRKE